MTTTNSTTERKCLRCGDAVVFVDDTWRHRATVRGHAAIVAGPDSPERHEYSPFNANRDNGRCYQWLSELGAICGQSESAPVHAQGETPAKPADDLSGLYGVGGEVYTFIHQMRNDLMMQEPPPRMYLRAQELLDKIRRHDAEVEAIARRVMEECKAAPAISTDAAMLSNDSHCAHCDKDFVSIGEPGAALCPPCFMAGHRGFACGKYCVITEQSLALAERWAKDYAANPNADPRYQRTVAHVTAPITSDAARRVAEKIGDEFYFTDAEVKANYAGREREIYDAIAAIITAELGTSVGVEDALAELREMFPYRWLSIKTRNESAVFQNGEVRTGLPETTIVDEMSERIIGRGATLTEAMQKVRDWKLRHFAGECSY